MTAKSDADPWMLARAALFGAASLVPIAAAVFTLLSDGSPIPWWRRYDAGSWVGFLGTFGFVDATLGVGWQRGCRVAAIGIVGLVASLVIWPPIALGESANQTFVLVGSATVVVPFAVVAIPTEYALRSADRPRPTRVEWIALAPGVGHLLTVHWLTTTLQHRPLLPSPTGLLEALREPGAVDPAGLAALAAVVTGLVLLGSIPVVLAWRFHLVTPPTGVLLAFGWAAYRTWLRSLETLPPAGPGFGISPTPLTLYTWGAPPLLVAVLALAGIEYLVRRTLGIAPPPSLVGDGSGGERR